jgi:peptidoglycan/LPS O-acetylase OafA/YrhL
MPRSQFLSHPSRKEQVFTGLALIALGLILSIMMVRHPDQLRVPHWAAFMASCSSAVAGAAVTLRSFVAERIYSWMMVSLLTAMAAIPAWIAFGPGERFYKASLSFLSVDIGCSLGFGVATVFLLVMQAIVIRSALRQSK